MSDVTISDLVAGYGDEPVLRDLTLTIESGEFLAVLGSSGSGKTTLLRILAGFLRPDSGTVTIGDDVVAGPGSWVPPERRKLGVVPQEGALFPHLDVYRNVAFGLRGESQIKERVEEVLKLVDMSDYIHARPQELSGGQQQRIALARALAPRPELLLLDEPFSALDASMRESLRRDVRALLEQLGTTTIMVTHDQEEALSIARRVALVREGRIVQLDTPEGLYEHPVDLATARFVGDIIELPAQRADATSVDSPLGRLGITNVESAVSDGVVVLRPEQVAVVEARPVGDVADSKGALGRVRSMSYHGHDSLLDVTITGGYTVRVRTPGLSSLHIDDDVRVLAIGDGLLFPEA